MRREAGVYIGQAGDLVTVNEYGVWRWVETGLECLGQRALAEEARPLVVIDPEDREQVETLRTLLASQPLTQNVATEAMQAALREFADPKPPKPEEPTGLGAVVEDADGKRWTRAGDAYGDEFGEFGNWLSIGSTKYVDYADIAAVRVLSEGVQA